VCIEWRERRGGYTNWEQMELLGVASRIMNAQIFYGNATAGLQVAIPMGKGQHATSCKQGYGGPRCSRMRRSTPRVVMSAR